MATGRQLEQVHSLNVQEFDAFNSRMKLQFIHLFSHKTVSKDFSGQQNNLIFFEKRLIFVKDETQYQRLLW
uniref:Uncharacterized protein n=1 Tax=Romanomermis culicivorax TaxID=13658 RepID=A0A915J0U6_ROMCU